MDDHQKQLPLSSPSPSPSGSILCTMISKRRQRELVVLLVLVLWNFISSCVHVRSLFSFNTNNSNSGGSGSRRVAQQQQDSLEFELGRIIKKKKKTCRWGFGFGCRFSTAKVDLGISGRIYDGDVVVGQEKVVVVQKSNPPPPRPKDTHTHTNTTNIFPPPTNISTQWLFKDLNLSMYAASSCGLNKCLFESNFYNRKKTTPPTTNLYGYLVSQFYDVDSQQRLQGGWELAMEGETKFGIRHLLRGPPYHNVGDFGDDLASKLNKVGRRRSRQFLAWNSSQSFPIINSIQPVEILPSKPTTSLFGFKKNKSRFRDGLVHLSQIIMNFNKTTDNASSSQLQPLPPPTQNKKKSIRDLDQEDINLITNKISYKEFESNLHQDFDATLTMLTRMDESKYHTLLIDFQVLFDLRYGHIYHLDFDRAFCMYLADENYSYVERIKEVTAGMNVAIESILEWKKRMLNITYN